MDIKDICGPPAWVEFKDTSTDAVAWEWDFDYYNYASYKDAVTKEASTTYQYTTGAYVGLRTYNAAGCSKQVLKEYSDQYTIGEVLYVQRLIICMVILCPVTSR